MNASTPPSAGFPPPDPNSGPPVSRQSLSQGRKPGRKFLGFLTSVALVIVSAIGGWMTIQFFFSTPSVSTLPGSYESVAQFSPVPPADISPQPAASVAFAEPSPAPLQPEPAPKKQSPEEGPASEETNEKLENLRQLRDQLSSSDAPTEGLYLTVARSFEETGKMEDALEITREGRQSFPDSDSLLLAESDLLALTGSPEQAWQQLARTGKVGDRQFFSRILRFGVDAGKYDETLVILSTAHTTDFEWSQEDWKALVSLYEQTDQIDRAIRVAEKRLSDHEEADRLRSTYRGEKNGQNLPE